MEADGPVPLKRAGPSAWDQHSDAAAEGPIKTRTIVLQTPASRAAYHPDCARAGGRRTSFDRPGAMEKRKFNAGTPYSVR